MAPSDLAPQRGEAAGLRAPPSPAAVLKACSWLGGEEAGLARVRNLSSSHSVHVVTRADGEEVIVKRSNAASKRGIAQELFVYRLAGWVPGLARILPRVLHIDESVPVLVLEALPAARRRLHIRSDPPFHRSVGQALATVHRTTLGIAMLPSLAMGILDVADHPDSTGADRPEQTRALMLRIASDPSIADALRQAKADYRPTCLIHGDLRPDHWIEMADGSLRLIDWEMGGGGDPALDLASALVEPCLDQLRSGFYDGDWIEPSRALVRAIVEGYSGQGVVPLTSETARDHVVRLGAARLLHVATEWSDTGQLGRAVDATFDQAKSLLDRRSVLAELLIP